MLVRLAENFRAVFYAPFYAAIALGFHRDEGVEIALVESATPGAGTAGLLDGSIDVTWGGPMRVMKARDEGGPPLVCFTEVVRRDPFYLVGKTRSEGAPAFTLAELPGTRFASVCEVPTPWLCLQHDIREAGIDPASVPRIADRTMAENLAALERGEVDMALLVAAPEAPAVQRLLRAPDIDLWHWRRAEAYARQMPVLARLDLPEGAVDLMANLPPRDLTLLSLKAILVTTPDIHPVLVDLLLDAARAVHGGSGLLHRAGDFPQPDATEYPMSADAERYHKSGPSALQRYLPYWAVVWIQRLIYFGLPLVVVGLPLTRALPALYRWAMRRRVYRLYGELAYLEREASADPARRARALQRLAQIEQRVHRLRTPASFAAEAYMLRMHLDFVRSRWQALSRAGPDGAAAAGSSEPSRPSPR